MAQRTITRVIKVTYVLKATPDNLNEFDESVVDDGMEEGIKAAIYAEADDNFDLHPDRVKVEFIPYTGKAAPKNDDSPSVWDQIMERVEEHGSTLVQVGGRTIATVYAADAPDFINAIEIG